MLQKNTAFLFDSEKLKTKSSDREIETVTTVNNDSGTPIMYVINYKENRGFILISATRDYMPILGYSEEGHFSVKDINQSSASSWFFRQKALLNSIDNMPDSIKLKYRNFWAQYSLIKKMYSPQKTRSASDNQIQEIIMNSVSRWMHEGYEVMSLENFMQTSQFLSLSSEKQQEIISEVTTRANKNYLGGAIKSSFALVKDVSDIRKKGPLTKTTWGQSGNYAQFTPNNNPAGCVAVAVAQILRYYEFPKYYNWNKMPYDYATSEIAQLLSDVGQAVKMDYSGGGSGSIIPYACSEFNKTWGYLNATLVNHNTSIVRSELDLGHLVMMSGYDSSGFLGFHYKGHDWVCDGYSLFDVSKEIRIMSLEDCPDQYIPRYISSYPTFKITDTDGNYFYMNWGWNGLYNGAFYDDNVDIPNENLNLAHDRRDIINLFPSK